MRHLQRGFSFVELLVVTTIILILASAVQPLAKVTIQRTREAEQPFEALHPVVNRVLVASRAGEVGTQPRFPRMPRREAGFEVRTPRTEAIEPWTSLVSARGFRAGDAIATRPVGAVAPSSPSGFEASSGASSRRVV